jgi:putative flippase GtrA
MNELTAENGWLFSTIWRYRTFIKYCAVGCLVTGVDFAIFTLCFYKLVFGSILSKLFAFCGAVILSYALNRTWTFRSHNKNVRQQFSKFLTVSLVGAGLSSLGIYLQIDVLAVLPLIANGITSGLALTWNFLANKYWTFRVTTKQRIDRWGFDMEILRIAQGIGIPIREKGVTWRDIPGSRLRPLRDAVKTSGNSR